MPTQKDVQLAVESIGVNSGDILLVHSSFKSLGVMEGGAEAVISGILDVLGPEGTLVFPTFSMKNFGSSYETWHINKPSDTGYLTEYFRTRPGSLRSDQATHSVAARGKLAHELTHEHSAYGHRLCPFGQSAFADSSPWVKMYHLSAKVVFLGVNMRCNTLKHMIEGFYIEQLLSSVANSSERALLQTQLWTFENRWQGIWLFYDSVKMQEHLTGLGLVTETQCGNATFYCVDAKVSSDAALEALRTHPENWFEGDELKWIRACEATRQ